MSVRVGADNQIPNGANAGNLTTIVPGAHTGKTVRFDLNGHVATINGLNAPNNGNTANEQVGNFQGSGPSTLTLGAGNASGDFEGVVAPEHPLGWVHRSYCLHELKKTEEARENLLRVVDKFPEDPIIRYNPACYECRLGRLEQAKSWLQKSFELGDPKIIKLMAFEDPDLEQLWREIRET